MRLMVSRFGGNTGPLEVPGCLDPWSHMFPLDPSLSRLFGPRSKANTPKTILSSFFADSCVDANTRGNRRISDPCSLFGLAEEILAGCQAKKVIRARDLRAAGGYEEVSYFEGCEGSVILLLARSWSQSWKLELKLETRLTFTRLDPHAIWICK